MISSIVEDINRIDIIEATANAAGGMVVPIVSVPSLVYGGQQATFTITNYGNDLTYLVTGNDGSLGAVTGDTFTWTFTNGVADRDQELYVKATKDGYTDSPSLVEVINVVYFPVEEDQALIYTGASMANFDELVNTEIVANQIVATAIDTTNIVEGYDTTNAPLISSTDPFQDGSLVAKYEMEDATATVGTNPTNTNVTFSSGKFGDAGVFNGSSSYLGSGLSIDNSANHTISIFVNIIDKSVQQCFIGGFGSNIIRHYFGVKDGNYWTGLGADQKAITPATGITNNTWNHIVLKTTATTFEYYVNGSIVDSGTYSGGGVASNIDIGCANSNGTRSVFTNGLIDQVEIYNKSLTPTEITTLYAQGAENFTTSTQIIDGDTLNIDGTDVVASGVTSGIIITGSTDQVPDGGGGGVTASNYQDINTVPEDAFTDSEEFGWTAAASTTGWLQYYSASSFVVNKYTLQNKYATIEDRMPRDWTIEASNTGAFSGEEVTLDTVTDEVSWGNLETRTFTFTNSSAYNYYRIVITTINGGATINIGKMELIEGIEEILYTVPTTGTATTAYINQHTATVGTPIDQDGGETDFVGLDDGSTPFTQDLKFTNISTATATDVLTTATQIKDGDDLVIVKDDGSVVEYDGISGVSFDSDGANNLSITDSTPIMTSNSSPSGLCVANDEHSTFPAYKAFSDTLGTGWLTNGVSATNNHLSFVFDNNVVINKATISGVAQSAYPTRSLKDFRIEASLDTTTGLDGTWTTIRASEDSGTWSVGEVRTYTWVNEVAYKGYRIYAETSNDATYSGIGEVELIEAQPVYLYTLNPTISEIPTRAYAVDSKTKFNVGDNGFVEAVKNNDVYTVKTPSFETVLYTGNGATQTVPMAKITTGVDFAWIKNRGSVVDHKLVDSINTSALETNTTEAAADPGVHVASFGATSFDLQSSSTVNGNGSSFVAWCASLPNHTPSNTDGTITSETKSNDFMSVVSHIGTGVNATVGHGLGKTPELIIVKNRSIVAPWAVYSKYITASNYMQLNDTIASSSSNAWNSTEPTDDVISVAGVNDWTNSSGNNFITYAFTSVEGQCKVGSYTGTGAAGNIVDCGFEPAWIMIKRTDSTSNWFLWDNQRGDNVELYPDSPNAEGTADRLDFTSTGFTIKDTTTNNINASGGTYIFLAIADTIDLVETTRTYDQLLTGTGRTLQTQIELESEGNSTSRLSATVLKAGA